MVRRSFGPKALMETRATEITGAPSEMVYKSTGGLVGWAYRPELDRLAVWRVRLVGQGHRPLKAEIGGSNPPRATKTSYKIRPPNGTGGPFFGALLTDC